MLSIIINKVLFRNNLEPMFLFVQFTTPCSVYEGIVNETVYHTDLADAWAFIKKQLHYVLHVHPFFQHQSIFRVYEIEYRSSLQVHIIG